MCRDGALPRPEAVPNTPHEMTRLTGVGGQQSEFVPSAAYPDPLA